MTTQKTKIEETVDEAKANRSELIAKAGSLWLFGPGMDADPKAVALKNRYINAWENEEQLGMAAMRVEDETDRMRHRLSEIEDRLSGDYDIVAVAGRLAQAMVELNTAVKARAFYKDLLA